MGNIIYVTNIFGIKREIVTTGHFYPHTDYVSWISNTSSIDISQLVASLYCIAIPEKNLTKHFDKLQTLWAFYPPLYLRLATYSELDLKSWKKINMFERK